MHTAAAPHLQLKFILFRYKSHSRFVPIPMHMLIPSAAEHCCSNKQLLHKSKAKGHAASSLLGHSYSTLSAKREVPVFAKSGLLRAQYRGIKQGHQLAHLALQAEPWAQQLTCTSARLGDFRDVL